MKSLIRVLIFTIVNYCHGYNILVMMPMPFYSHTKSYLPLFIELAKRGHNVTMVSPYPLKEPVPNFNEIVIDNSKTERELDNMDPREFDDTGFISNIIGMQLFCPLLLGPALESEGLKAFLNETDSKFDMVVTETFFCQEPFIALAHKYGAIRVTAQPMILPLTLSRITGNPNNPAVVPTGHFPLSERMNFLERSKNALTSVLDYIATHATWMYMDRFVRKHFANYHGFSDMPPLVDMFQNISLVLLDNHMVTSYPRPFLSNTVQIGGLTIKEGSELDPEWAKYMNESVDGVIYFSWGSVYKTKFMKPHEIAAFMSAFGKLKRRVLMKVDEGTILPGKPDNVRLVQWVPQASILGHPNLRAFISHGGLHSLLEGTYHGVPIVGTPLFADQENNIGYCERAGYCVQVDLKTLTGEILLDAINRVLTNSSYKENALKRSRIMKDRPVSVMDNAVYWVEYVLRHRGAPHLRSAAVELAWYQYLLLDVVAVWGTVLVLAVLLLKKAVRWCLCKARKPKSKKD